MSRARAAAHGRDDFVRRASSAAPRSTPTAPRSPTRRWRPASAPTPCCWPRSAARKWDTTDPDAPRPEQGLLGLRKGLGLFANLRPVRPVPGALRREPAQARAHRGHRPARRTRADRRDLLRQEDAHGAQRERPLRVLRRRGRPHRARRLRRRALRRKHVTSVDKANVLETSRQWREVVHIVHKARYNDIALTTCSSTTRRCSWSRGRPTSTSSSPRTCSATSSATRPR